MSWLESIPPLLLARLLAVVIAGLAVGLAWWAHWGARRLLRRWTSPWVAVGVWGLQAFILAGGLALIAAVTGIGTAALLAALGAAFLAGAAVGDAGRLADRTATAHIRAYYTVGDTVTLGDGVHGVVTAIDAHCTHLDGPQGGCRIIPNRLVVRHPIAVHKEDETAPVAPSSAPVAAAHSPSTPPASEATANAPTGPEAAEAETPSTSAPDAVDPAALAHSTEPDVEQEADSPMPLVPRNSHSVVRGRIPRGRLTGRTALGRRTIHALRGARHS